jgi:hypothetical protein
MISLKIFDEKLFALLQCLDDVANKDQLIEPN